MTESLIARRIGSRSANHIKKANAEDPETAEDAKKSLLVSALSTFSALSFWSFFLRGQDVGRKPKSDDSAEIL